MRVIAFDPGYRLGYAVGEAPDTLIEAGTFYAQRQKIKEISLFVTQLFEKYRPDRVIIEDFRIYNNEYKSKHTTPEIIGSIKTLCVLNGIEYELVNHNAWKAQFERMFFSVNSRLSQKWITALTKGSEHSRDAVAMLMLYVIDLKTLLKKEG